ncbi:hypothetical protein BCR39DRAFT_515711 [Naematelia encephala]|uniref:Uncharacterized protein n=1 Tax=Naematelia encephala TaxID=71784 RepID=A0A1Y2BJZ5_9TREE|nr:hypothetical protein BCR39DRAFT_515711 [Naematelia encephala]
MSSPTGSTAPAITSPLLAWPSRPSPSTGVYSNASMSSFYSGLPTASSTASLATSLPSSSSAGSLLKGKEREREHDQDPRVQVIVLDERGEKKYAPPKRPLSPHQLGRIAQSFGIVIPSLPHSSSSSSLPPPSPSASSSTSRPSFSRPSPYLLAVIPPLSLLVSDDSQDAEQSNDRQLRWQRGRLLPLQPTMGSMLLVIAREYGLPSVTGINLYLVDSTSHDDKPGPMISGSTWTTLFPKYNTSQPPSRVATPMKGLNDPVFPPSPASLLEKHSQGSGSASGTSTDPSPTKPPLSARSQSSFSSHLPATPLSPHFPTNPVVGTITFDVDPRAAWLGEYRRSGRGRGHKRQISTASEGGGGMRQLRLPAQVHNARPRFLRELDQNQTDPFMRLSDEEDIVPTSFAPSATHGPGRLERLPSARNGPGRRLSIRDIGANQALSTSVSLDFAEHVTAEESSEGLLEPEHVANELLASPIELEHAALERVRMDETDKRGSAVVLSEELDDLEKMMRQLSPREIRLTSPRILTPRMAQKVAQSQQNSLALPLPPRRPGTSPLAGSFTSRAVSDPPKAAWPASPRPAIRDMFHHLPSPPSVPGSNELSPVPMVKPISVETLKRMQSDSSPDPTKGNSDWRPRRPPRPPSPNLTHARTLSHSLSPEAIDHLRSPEAPTSVEREGKRRTSTGLKGFRSARNLNGLFKGDRERESHKLPDVPSRESTVSSTKEKEKEAVGLFKNQVETTSTFPGLSTTTTTTATIPSEFGTNTTVTISSPPPPRRAMGRSSSSSSSPKASTLPLHNNNTHTHSSSSNRSFSSRLLHSSFSFSRKTHNPNPSSSSSHHTGSEMNKRSISISSPILNQHDSPLALDGYTQRKISGGNGGEPTSPASLKSVKRKPVPGLGKNTSSKAIKGDTNIDGERDGEGQGEGDGERDGDEDGDGDGDFRRFVLEDPTKGRIQTTLVV